jgi:putative MATE family efflux protein
LGDSLSALIFLLISAGLNVALDLLFVAKFGLGVPGVAIATVIAQVISAGLCYWKLTRMQNVFDLAGKYLKLVPNMAMRIIRIGLPSGITQGIMAGAGMVVQTLTNSMGEMFIACNVIVMRVDGFAMLPNLTFGQAMSVYTGQNVGANKLDRVHQGTKQGSIMALTVSAVITGILLLFGKYLFAIFTDTQELIDLAVKMMRVLALGYICVSVTQVLGGVMRGAGDTMTPMWITLIATIALRIPTAYIMAHFTKSADYPNGHPVSIFTSLLVSWTIGMIISIVVFRIGKWKAKMHASAEQYQK